MYALALQVNQNITPEEFWAQALKTGETIKLWHDGNKVKLGPILNSVKLIEAISNN